MQSTTLSRRWSLLLNKEYFKFSCAHFLIFPDGSKERLHGHNYHVCVEIEAALDDSGLVLDFIEVKPVVRALCDELDEHYILPCDHPEIRYECQDDGHTTWAYRSCRYLAPTEEIRFLPINNSSVENLANWFAGEITRRLQEHFPTVRFTRLTVAISETRGQSGEVCLRWDEA